MGRGDVYNRSPPHHTQSNPCPPRAPTMLFQDTVPFRCKAQDRGPAALVSWSTQLAAPGRPEEAEALPGHAEVKVTLDMVSCAKTVPVDPARSTCMWFASTIADCDKKALCRPPSSCSNRLQPTCHPELLTPWLLNDSCLPPRWRRLSWLLPSLRSARTADPPGESLSATSLGHLSVSCKHMHVHMHIYTDARRRPCS